MSLPRAPYQCGACETRFSSLGAFDTHRVGRHQPLTRRCLSEAEMLKRGLELNAKGQWRIAADAERAASLKAA